MTTDHQTASGLHFEVTGRNHAPALVLLHPLGAHSGTWQAQLAEFERFFRVIRIDLRGHGRSASREGTPEPCRIEDLAREVLEVLDHVGVERAHWCGLSIGGAIALQVAVSAPRRVMRLVLANTAASFPPATVATITALVEASPSRGYLECCNALREVDLRARLGEVQAPTLIIAGAQDPATSVERAEELMTGITGADLLVLDAAHLSNVEQVADFTTAVVDFLRD